MDNAEGAILGYLWDRVDGVFAAERQWASEGHGSTRQGWKVLMVGCCNWGLRVCIVVAMMASRNQWRWITIARKGKNQRSRLVATGLLISLLSLWLQGIWRLDCEFWNWGFWLASKFGFLKKKKKWEIQLYANFLAPSRKMIESTLWWRKTRWWGIFFFLVIFSGSFLWWCFNKLVFALIPKLMQDNQNKIETTIK